MAVGHAAPPVVGCGVSGVPSTVIVGVAPKYATVTNDPLAPEVESTSRMLPVVVIVMIVETEFVPSLMVIEYWPACTGEFAWSVTKLIAPLASVEILPVVVE